MDKVEKLKIYFIKYIPYVHIHVCDIIDILQHFLFSQFYILDLWL